MLSKNTTIFHLKTVMFIALKRSILHKRIKVMQEILSGDTYILLIVPFQAIDMKFSSFERYSFKYTCKHLSSGFPTRSDTNRALRPHKMARGIEIPDLERRWDCTIYVVYKQVT